MLRRLVQWIKRAPVPQYVDESPVDSDKEKAHERDILQLQVQKAVIEHGQVSANIRRTLMSDVLNKVRVKGGSNAGTATF